MGIFKEPMGRQQGVVAKRVRLDPPYTPLYTQLDCTQRKQTTHTRSGLATGRKEGQVTGGNRVDGPQITGSEEEGTKRNR